MEFLAFTAIVAVSVALGLATSRLALWALFFFMIGHAAVGDTAVAPLAVEPGYAPHLGLVTPAP